MICSSKCSFRAEILVNVLVKWPENVRVHSLRECTLLKNLYHVLYGDSPLKTLHRFQSVLKPLRRIARKF